MSGRQQEARALGAGMVCSAPATPAPSGASSKTRKADIGWAVAKPSKQSADSRRLAGSRTIRLVASARSRASRSCSRSSTSRFSASWCAVTYNSADARRGALLFHAPQPCSAPRWRHTALPQSAVTATQSLPFNLTKCRRRRTLGAPTF